MGPFRSSLRQHSYPRSVSSRLRGYALFVLLLLASFHPAAAQEKLLPVFHFNRITTADGLPKDDMITRIYRDRKGFIWIGMEKGVSRYDGYGFKHYLHLPDDSSSLSSNIVTMLTEDREQRFWIGTWDAGLSVYDPVRDRFVNFRPRAGDSTWLQTRTIFSMIEDSAGILWFGTGLGGIVRAELPEIQKASDIESLAHTIRFRSYPLGMANYNTVYDMCLHPDGKIIVASDSGLLFFDRRTGAVSRPNFAGPLWQQLNLAQVQHLAQDHSGNLWLATTKGLFKINWGNGRVLNYRHSIHDSLSITYDHIQDLAEDRQGNLWLASLNGVDLFSPTTGKRVPYLTSGQAPHGSIGISLSIDAMGTLWVRSNSEGVFALSQKSFRFPHFSIRQGDGSARKLESIERTPDGNFWICSEGRVLQVDLQRQMIVKSIDGSRNGQSMGGISNKHASHLDENGTLWYGLWGSGLYSVNLITTQVNNFRYPNPLGAGANVVVGIAPGSRNSLWIAALHDGLMAFYPTSGKFARILRSPTVPRVFDIMTDRGGKVWIATELDGLYVLDPATSVLDHFVHDRSDSRSLSDDLTFNVFEDSTRRIWIGAANVINLWDPENRSFRRFPNRAFLNANSAGAVGTDRKGRLWVSYDGKELAVLEPSTGRFTNFDPSDGVAGGGIDMENLPDGRVLLTGSSGLNIFDPDKVLDIHRAPPPLVITRMTVNDFPVVPPELVDGNSSLHLSHDQDAIEIEFAALDIDAPQLVRYRYRLEGLEKEWVELNDRRFVRYPGLRPGEYVFRIKAESSRGEWHEQELALGVSIAPPWWQTRWAYTGYVMLLLGFITTAYRLRLRQVRLKQQAEMEHFQAERLAEVDKLKSRFFANVSHEFRTPLTLILGPAEEGIAADGGGAAREKFQVIRDNARSLLALVSQLLDFSHIESGMMRLQVSKGDIVEILRRRVMSFESWAERKMIDLDFRSEIELASGFFDTDKLEKILNNLMSNALKFTPEGGSISVSLQHPKGQDSVPQNSADSAPGIDRDSSSFIAFAVSDTGPGISAEHLPHIFDRFYRVDETHTTEGTGIGLALTKELVELHHGTIVVESTLGKGSVFTVSLPIGQSAYRRDEILESPLHSEGPENAHIVKSPPASVDTSALQSADGKPIVLVVEDNTALRRYVREFLEANYAVQEAKDGKEGYDQAIEIVPDIVVSDLMMPKMDGMELCRALKNDVRTSHIPVILLTARAGTESKIEGLETGADDFVTKPFDSKELMARMRNLIEQRRLLRAKFSAGVVLKPGEVAVTSLDDTFLKRVMDTVEKRMGDESFGVEEIAHEVALSRRHLDRKLAGLTNLSAAEFVRHMRLQRARELLEKNAATVAEIAFQVGFGSPSYFTTCFRERFGCLPSEIRRQDS